MVYFTFVVDTVSTIFTYTCVYLVCNQMVVVFVIALLMSPFFAVYHNPLGYDSCYFSFLLMGTNIPALLQETSVTSKSNTGKAPR